MWVQTAALALCSSTKDATWRSDYFFYFWLNCLAYAMLRPTPPMAKTMNDALLVHCESALSVIAAFLSRYR